MTITGEQQLNIVVLRNLVILVAKRITEEPEVAFIVRELYGHRPGHERRVRPEPGTEQTGGIVPDKFLDLIDGFVVSEVFDL